MVCNYSYAQNNHWTYLKGSCSSPFLGVFSILGLWREVEAKCVTLNSNVDLFSLQIHRNHNQCKKKSTTTTRKVIRTFGQCPLKPRLFLMDLSPWHSVMVLTPKVPFDKWQYVGERAVFPLWLVFAPLFRNWIKVSRIRPVSHIGPPNNKLKMQNNTCYSYRTIPKQIKNAIYKKTSFIFDTSGLPITSSKCKIWSVFNIIVTHGNERYKLQPCLPYKKPAPISKPHKIKLMLTGVAKTAQIQYPLEG